MKLPNTIYITEKDLERLEVVISVARRSPNIDMLEEELARATIVPSEEVPSDVVTMNSRARFKDTKTGEEMEFTLSYPQQADIAEGRISVLAPVGSALLGLRVGDEIDWPLPSGGTRSLQITSVVFQPEATGQFHL